jgi:hypothetical protein
MVLRFIGRRLPKAALLGMGIWALGASAGYSQDAWRYRQPCYPPQPCPPYPCPAPQVAPAPSPTPAVTPETAPKAKPPAAETTPTPSATEQQQQQQQAQQNEQGPGEQQAAATAAGGVNMMGDLLGGPRSLLFNYSRAGDRANVKGFGATNLVNAKVADNNSPLPEDRVYFRYNFFDRANSVTGVGSIPSPAGGGITELGTVTKSFDLNAYTFGVEKTFFDRLASVELRIPFATGLASRLDLRAGEVGATTGDQDMFGNPLFNVISTPGNTFGHEDTEFGDMSVIFKALVYRNCWLSVSAGASLGIPTANDTRVSVTDFVGGAESIASAVRQREFHVSNDIWSLSPFVAFLAAPSDRFFAQGFMEFDFPLNDDKVGFSEQALTATGSQANLGFPPGSSQFGLLVPPYSASSGIRDQTLMQIDVGTGYWIYRNQGNQCGQCCESTPWITGIAPTLELHYTTTLNDARIVTVPQDIFAVPGATGEFGNQRNRVDILDLTVGTTVEIARQTTIATGFSFPLLQHDNRTFVWEFLFQINYYFGGPRGSRSGVAF